MRLKTTAIAVSLLAPLAAGAQGTVLVPDCPPPPRCEPRRPCPLIERLPCNSGPVVQRVRSDVRVQLVDRVLRYEVTETFVNRGAGLGEADYIFPLPADAAFQDLRLEINGELVSGETLGAIEARRIYEEIVRKQRDPALVEWMGHGLLRARIFPLNPGEEKRVVVRFQSVARREGDALRIDYFRGTAPSAGNAPRRDRRREPGATFSLEYPSDPQYGTAYSPTHDVDVIRSGSRRVAELRGGASDLTVLVPVRRASAPAITMLPHAAGENDRFALVTLSPPAIVARRAPREVTLVLDVSGSMRGRKMEQARQSALRLLETLSPDDRFRIIDFSTEVRSFPDENFASATPASIREARRYVERLEADGSTNISGALEEALRRRSRETMLSLVLFITDGEPTVGERRAEVIADSVRSWRSGRRVFTFGLGSDVNVALLEQMSMEGRGTAQFVRPDEDIERAVSLAASRLSTPVLTNVRLTADGVRLHQMLPGDEVDVFAGNDLVFLARYRGAGRARLTISGRTADGPVSWTTDVVFPDRERDNRFVPRLWATRRVGYLSAERRRNGPSRELDSEIRELGERYGIPTEFSSYLVLEPGMVANAAPPAAVRQGGGMRDMAAAATGAQGAASIREQRFEAAKAASAQRAVSSLAAAEGDAATTSSARRAGGRMFTLVDGVWTDGSQANSRRVVRIKPMSEAWFALAREVPDLKEIFALGDSVRVAGRLVVIEVTASGVEKLDDTEIAQVARMW